MVRGRYGNQSPAGAMQPGWCVFHKERQFMFNAKAYAAASATSLLGPHSDQTP